MEVQINSVKYIPGCIKYSLTIKPAIRPEERHKIEDALKKLGYIVHSGGTMTDMSECDITFEK